MENFIKAEIIYMESDVIFFATHWYVDVDEINYEVRKELTLDETERLIRALSEIEFTFRVLYVPASVSNVFRMQGFAIKLHYESEGEQSYQRNPFIILGQTGDYRYRVRMFGLTQARIGRVTTDEAWNAFISEFYFE
jgi:hypothetical protein